MKTQAQLFNALVRQHEATSYKPFSRSLLANVEFNPRDLKQFVIDELYFWVNIRNQALTSDVQRHLGNSYRYSVAHCDVRIGHIREVIAHMGYKVYTSDYFGFFAINPTKVKSHFIAFN
jgi:hypothetical protein